MKSVLYLYINNEAIIKHKDCDNKIFIGGEKFKYLDPKDEFYSLYSIFNFQELINFNSHAPRDIIDKMHKVFFPYVDQYCRWSFTRKINIDSMYDQFNKEIHRWHWFIKINKIKIIYFYEDPHHAFDLILYHVAILLGIKIYIFSTINIGYRSYLKNRIEDDLSLSKSVYIEKNYIDDLDVNLQHTGVILDNFKGVNFFIKLKEGARRKFKNIKGKIELYKKRTLITPIFRSFVLIYVQQKTFFIQAYIARILYIYKFKRNITTNLSVDDNSIIFYKHYFPERTTNPLSYPYLSQEGCIDILMQLDNNLIIKEHPASLSSKNLHRDRCAQKKSHIERYLKYGIPLLIDNVAKKHIVATMNGTVGLEMAIKGYKVVCFGNPWYGFLSNVHVYQTYNSLVEFIDAPVQNYENSIKNELLDMINAKTADFRVDRKYDKSQDINELICKEYLTSYEKSNN
jgi:hypothetical protein